MTSVNWKAFLLGVLDLVLIIILAYFLTRSVTNQVWITAQICLLGILLVLTLATWQGRRLLLDRSGKQKEHAADLGVATIVKLLQFTALGVGAIIIYAVQHSHWKSASVAKVAGVGLLTAGGSLAAGAVLGFIFGVPKSKSAPSTASGASAGSSGASGASSSGNGDGQRFAANTNLEEISDWLTKTIVGVSLVELTKLPPLLGKLAEYVGASMGDSASESRAVALVIMIYFTSSGFLISYLWTRMELTRVFNETELSKRISQLELQAENDAKAIATVDRWINHHPTNAQDEAKARTEILNAINLASSVTRARVFVSAEDYKRNQVPDPNAAGAKDRIRNASTLTLPIFEALVAADAEKIFHRNRGQYAFCLMTQTTPDWQKAFDTLQDAIAIRDRSKDPDWGEYEFARAICSIKLNPDAKTKPDIKSAIDADLKKADDLKVDPNKLAGLDLDNDAAKWKQP